MPIPCSPVHVPPIAIARMLTFCARLSAFSRSVGSFGSNSTTRWKLPSPTCPTIGAVNPDASTSARVASMHLHVVQQLDPRDRDADLHCDDHRIDSALEIGELANGRGYRFGDAV